MPLANCLEVLNGVAIEGETNLILEHPWWARWQRRKRIRQFRCFPLTGGEPDVPSTEHTPETKTHNFVACTQCHFLQVVVTGLFKSYVLRP